MTLFLAAWPALSTAADLQLVIPYEGELRLEGEPFTGEVDLEFRLYRNPDAPRQRCDGGFCFYQETHPAVRVSAGRFAVRLGSVGAPGPGLPNLAQNAPLAAGGAWVEVAVRLAGAADFVPLGGRRLLRAYPVALWAARTPVAPGRLPLGSPEARVPLTVTGDATFRGEFDAGLITSGPDDATPVPLRVATTVRDVTSTVRLNVTGPTTISNLQRLPIGRATYNESDMASYACGQARFKTPSVALQNRSTCDISAPAELLDSNPGDCLLTCIAGRYRRN